MTEKRTALVTGANRGIGLEVCRQLAEVGCRVILTSRNEEKGKKAVGQISGDVHHIQLDVTEPESVDQAGLNALTIKLAAGTKGSGILINAVCPGWVRTDMGGEEAPRSVEKGASGIVWAATLPADGPTGGFFRDGKRIDW